MGRIVLIVEDYVDTRNMMKFILQSYGYEVIEAADGLEALEKVKKIFPDLILMDIAMPVMDGITSTRAIRKIEQGAKVPIIAVTANGKEFYNQAIEAGCNDLIAKPVDFESLERVLNGYF